MRQVLAIVAAAALAALGAVVLGEYPLEGTTVLVGFPLYAVAVTETALAVGRRLPPLALAVLAVVVAGGLTWALWISFGHFRNAVRPPTISWVMVGVAVAATVFWGRSGSRRGSGRPAAEAGPAGPDRPSKPADEEVLP